MSEHVHFEGESCQHGHRAYRVIPRSWLGTAREAAALRIAPWLLRGDEDL